MIDTQEIDNNEDLIDSRDVIARIEYLKSELAAAASEEYDSDDYADMAEELATLQAFAEEGEQFADWLYGVTFIRDSYFEQYAEDYLNDTTEIPDFLSSYINYKKFAEDLQMDYGTVDFDGVTYWAR